MTHTPGPLQVILREQDTWNVERISDGIRSVTAICYGSLVAEEHGGSARGNATLYSAAPALLAACEKVISVIEQGQSGLWWSRIADLEVNLKAAIELAKSTMTPDKFKESMERLAVCANAQKERALNEAREWPPAEHTLRRWEAHGLQCAIAQGFTLCGYVHVGANHPNAMSDYDEVDVEVHGGLTFGCKAMDGGRWFGFDTGHAGDMIVIHQTGFVDEGRIWTEDDVAQETEKLAEQLAARRLP